MLKILCPTKIRKQFGENYAQIPQMIVYKFLFTFKGGYAIEMNTLHWYGSWFIDKNLRSLFNMHILALYYGIVFVQLIKNVMYN